jgi:protein TonB
MSRRSGLVVLSVFAHAVVLCAIVVVSVMATGAIPTPFDRLAFAVPNTVKLADVPLPAVRRAERQPATSPSAAALPTAAPAASAPIVAPSTIAAETSVPLLPANAGPEAAASARFPSDAFATSEPLPPPPPAPPAPLRVSSGVKPPERIFNVDPVYPAAARAARIEGLVVLEVVINAEGRVESARVLRSVPLLGQAALDAVRQWRYTPTLLNGAPVPIIMTLTVNFSLSAR